MIFFFFAQHSPQNDMKIEAQSQTELTARRFLMINAYFSLLSTHK